MNGVCSYDFNKNEYITIEVIEKSATVFLLNTIKEHNMSGFLFSIEDNKLSTYFENTNTPNAQKFIDERRKKYKKAFYLVDSFIGSCLEKNIVYYSISDKKEKLIDFYNQLKTNKFLNIEFYKDVYEPDFWYLEVSSCKASKYNALIKLKEIYGFDNIIGFGDNLNDLPLFNGCNSCYAVANAKEQVKQKATKVIDSNENFGVVKFILKNNDLTL